MEGTWSCSEFHPASCPDGPTRVVTDRAVATQLLGLCRAYVREQRPDWPPDDDSTKALIAAARPARLTPLLAGLSGAGGSPTGQLAASLQRDLYRSAARRLELNDLAGTLLAGLEAAGIPVIVLKGAVLGERAWRDPAHRPVDDVDLLVRRQDVRGVLDIAHRLGLARVAERHSLAFDLRFGAAVVLTRAGEDLTRPSLDVHWRLLEDWRYGDSTSDWLGSAWARAEPTAFAGRPVLTLALPDLLVHLAAHLALHHAFEGWLWHCDIALLLFHEAEALDWDIAVRAAESIGFKSALALALACARVMFGVGAPPDIEQRLQSRSLRSVLARRLALSRVLNLASLEHLEHVLPLLLLDSNRACASALARWVVPPREWIGLRYAPSPWPFGYVRHGGDVVRVAARTLGRR